MTTISVELGSYGCREYIVRPGDLLKGLSIRVFGQARTKFEVPARSSRYRLVPQEGVEVFLNTNIYLFGRQDGPAFLLKAGTHKYKFSCQLPEQLPNSTQVRYGNIEYFVEAVLEIPYLFDKEIRMPFYVDCDDLNYCESVKLPVRRVDTRSISQYESLSVTVMLPCSGYVANQNIPITIFYENNSNLSVMGTKITFIQSIECRNMDRSESKHEKNIVVERYVEGVNARNQKSVSTNFIVPDVVMSNTKYCGIITVRYVLEVESELCGVNDNIKFEIPIIIGKREMREVPTAPTIVYATAPPREQVDEELPPSYEELMRLKPY